MARRKTTAQRIDQLSRILGRNKDNFYQGLGRNLSRNGILDSFYSSKNNADRTREAIRLLRESGQGGRAEKIRSVANNELHLRKDRANRLNAELERLNNKYAKRQIYTMKRKAQGKTSG